jgi:hypothetical protein
MGDERAVRVLLELGADPNAGGTAAPLHMWDPRVSPASRNQIAALLLQHGADCLLPAGPDADDYRGSSVLVALGGQFGMHSFAALLLAHLERQRAAGQLQLGSAARAGQLLLCGTRLGHEQLFSHSLRCLGEQLSAEEGVAAASAAAGRAHLLENILDAAIREGSSSSPASLEALLASGLPFDLAAMHDVNGGSSLLTWTALADSCPADKVRLLHQAGVPVTAADLLAVVDTLSVPGVAALLSVSRPAVDTSEPTHSSFYDTSYSCPIHRALHIQVRTAASLGPGLIALAARHPESERLFQQARGASCEWVASSRHAWQHWVEKMHLAKAAAEPRPCVPVNLD